MIILANIVIAYFFVLFLILILLIILLLSDKKEQIQIFDDYPFISVLVAVRNEENNINDCLDHLNKLNWPEDRYEVLLGNDGSTDRSLELMQQYIVDKAKFRIVEIQPGNDTLKGKANVLAQLCRQAKGSLFCIADADITVEREWLTGLAGSFKNNNTGIVSGVTLVHVINSYAAYQAIDWINAFAMFRVLNNFKVPVTAVGNNMSISRDAYYSTGGYEKIPFSITEDYQLFRYVLKNGWSFKNLLQEEALSFTKPIENLSSFLKQRKRWTSGAMQLPFYLVAVLGLQAVTLPFIICAVFFIPNGYLLWLGKVLLNTIFTYIGLKKINKVGFLKYQFFYELYSPICNFLSLIYYWLPTKTEWKGREYD